MTRAGTQIGSPVRLSTTEASARKQRACTVSRLGVALAKPTLVLHVELTELARHTPPTREMSRYTEGRWPILGRRVPGGQA